MSGWGCKPAGTRKVPGAVGPKQLHIKEPIRACCLPDPGCQALPGHTLRAVTSGSSARDSPARSYQTWQCWGCAQGVLCYSRLLCPALSIPYTVRNHVLRGLAGVTVNQGLVPGACSTAVQHTCRTAASCGTAPRLYAIGCGRHHAVVWQMCPNDAAVLGLHCASSTCLDSMCDPLVR